MSSPSAAVTVIVPTRAQRERSHLLKRAVTSVLEQQGVRGTLLVVVNGNRRDSELIASLQADGRIQVVAADQESLPSALHLGRSRVDTPFFSELDDDDVLLPGALLARVRALEEHSDCAAVVTNGVLRHPLGETLHVASFADARRDPLRSIVKANWLLPGSWLCRTSAVDAEVFRRMPQYLECTYLGIHLANSHRICFLDAPTVAWYVDTPGSVSKSREYQLGTESAIQRILDLDLPADVRLSLRKKLAASRHSVARLHLSEGDRWAAWRHHLHALRGPGGWQYWRFTMRLLLGKVDESRQ